MAMMKAGTKKEAIEIFTTTCWPEKKFVIFKVFRSGVRLDN